MVHVQAPSHAAGLTAPAGAAQDLLADRGPFMPAGRLPTLSSRCEHVASEALAWRARLAAAWKGLKDLGDPRLEHGR